MENEMMLLYKDRRYDRRVEKLVVEYFESRLTAIAIL